MSSIKDCPKCGALYSMEAVSESKDGFSVGKAIAGTIIAGPIGLVAGTLGKKKVTYQCRKCGYIIQK